MKKLIALLLLLILALFSCKEDADETINMFDELNDKMPWKDYTQFAKYTDYLTIPDFLTEQQADLYKKAVILHYIFYSAPSELERIPLLQEQEKLEPAETGGGYAKSIGRYRNWHDFKELALSVFTQDFFEKLNKNAQFISIEQEQEQGDLYISADTEIVQMSLAYAPWHKPDKAELISASETEIKFEVTGYYLEELDNDNGEITSLFIEIILTRTETGWRFSQFATAGNPYVFDK